MRALLLGSLALLGTAGAPRSQGGPADTELHVRGVKLDELDAIEARLVGREQGDNDFRSATPALQRVDRHVVKVDTDQLHRQKLALYGDAVSAGPAPPPAASARQAAAPAQEAERPARTRFPFAMLGALVAAVTGLLVWGVRRAGS